MKHLRRFSTKYSLLEQSNESSAGLTKEEIKDFCEINLAYLLDDGMQIVMDEYNNALFDNWSFDAKIYGIGTVVESKK